MKVYLFFWQQHSGYPLFLVLVSTWPGLSDDEGHGMLPFSCIGFLRYYMRCTAFVSYFMVRFDFHLAGSYVGPELRYIWVFYFEWSGATRARDPPLLLSGVKLPLVQY